MPALLRSCRLPLAVIFLFAVTAAAVQPARAQNPSPAPSLQLKPGDHISIIGNTLADRVQHDGWLETYITTRFPKHDLTFRNLGFSGDELTIRLRSSNFGTPDQWLTATKTDVIFAFFGNLWRFP